MLWAEVDGWVYDYFEADDGWPGEPYAHGFVELWQRKRGDRIAPAWRDYTWDELRPWWGFMVIIDVHRDPFDYRYRLFGTEVAKTFLTDVTGKRASQLVDNPLWVLEHDINFYEFLSSRPRLAHTWGSITWQDRSHVHTGFVELPLSDDGETVTNIFSLLHRKPAPSPPEPR